MMHWGKVTRLGVVAALAILPVAGFAQALQQDQPIEISSVKLDVFQDQHKAIFSGNVIAIQGTTNMRAAEMIVFYRDSGSDAKPAEGAAPAPAGTPQGIYRIESTGNVVFTTPTETAIGNKAIYNVDSNTIDLSGGDVTLTRGQNILKGNHLIYNMATGRSVLTGGAGGTTDVTGTGKPSRVHGLFVPKADKPAGKP